MLQRGPNDEIKYKDHDTLLSFYTEDVMRLAEREVRFALRLKTNIGTKRGYIIDGGGAIVGWLCSPALVKYSNRTNGV